MKRLGPLHDLPARLAQGTQRRTLPLYYITGAVKALNHGFRPTPVGVPGRRGWASAITHWSPPPGAPKPGGLPGALDADRRRDVVVPTSQVSWNTDA